MRDCGNCTWCCYFCAVPEYNSPENEYCGNCISDRGCSVYEERQEVCRNFGCLWWHDPQIPDSLRPDKCGVMFELPLHNQIYTAYVNPSDPNSYKAPRVQKLISKIVDTKHPVVIHIKDVSNVVFSPEGWTIEQVKQDLLKGWNKFKEVM